MDQNFFIYIIKVSLGCRVAIFFIILSSFSALVAAQTTTFTYQGRLTEASLPAAGTYQMQFSLWDAFTSGTQQGTTITNNSVTVANGVFTVQLNFTAAPFAAGANRWIEIAVKKPADPGFTTLAPRQQITSSPYAVRTLSASTADGLSNLCVVCVDDQKILTVSGSKVTGFVDNATNAIGAQIAVNANNAISAQSAVTANNVSGVVAIANGGTGNSTQSFVDITTSQNIGGVKTFTARPVGAASISSFAGAIATIPGNSFNYVFAGPTATATVAAGQRLTGVASATIAKGSVTTQLVDFTLCYQQGAGPVTNFYAPNQIVVSNGILSLSASASAAGFGAGSYNVGFCVRNSGTDSLNNNGVVSGWVMVTGN